MRKLVPITMAMVLGAIACTSTTRLSPAPGAQPAPPGVGEGAISTAAGVQIEARSNAWRGNPVTLEQEVTPILVEVTNNSAHPLMVRYSAFHLNASTGKDISRDAAVCHR
jgi:hypothetical protein